ncbi:MAG: hypothetical protein K9N51_12675, partial [Candidatus Pacebacteria bacterium]|nr:hypothetical protein [Candidatus Paceibacterota bacterium]
MTRVAAIFLLMAAGVNAGELFAGREWHRLRSHQVGSRNAIHGRENREQIVAIFYAFPDKMVAVQYQQTVIPGTPDTPVWERGGDAQLAYRGRARWGWDFTNFHHPQIRFTTADGDQVEVLPGILAEHKLNEQQAATVAQRSHGLLESLNVLQSRGKRVMGDFVWPLVHDGERLGYLVLRVVIFEDEPNWLYGHTFVCGDPRLRLRKLDLSSWGGRAGAVPPGAKQWLAGITSHGPAPRRNSQLPLQEYWVLAAHKRGWGSYDRRGSTAVFLQEDIDTLRKGAHNGCVSMELGPDARGVRYAISDFRGRQTPGTQIDTLRRQAPARKKRLVELDWQPPWQRELSALLEKANMLARDLPPDTPPLSNWFADYHRLMTTVEEG